MTESDTLAAARMLSHYVKADVCSKQSPDQ
eukprot:SAG22_NODE_3730_length_1555_cov_1.355769_2_plen_29_part_01